MKKLTFLIILTVVTETVLAQSFYNRRIDRRWVASAGTGTAKYFGELTNDGDVFQGTLYNIQGGLERKFNERISAMATLTFFQFRASDAKAADPGRIPRNLSFTSWNLELSVTGIIQLFPEVGRYYQRPVFNPYLFLGIGATYFNPMAEIPATDLNGNPFPDAGKKTSLRQYQTELVAYSPVTLVFPMGVGIKMMVAPQFNISVNGGYRYTLTDYLDDVSTVHPGAAAFSDPLAAALSDRGPEIGYGPRPAGSIRGNPEKNDGYFIFSIRLDYYLPPTTLFGGGNKGRGRYYKPKRGKRRNP